MGVHNLWKLLLPCGRRISVESLQNKVSLGQNPMQRTNCCIGQTLAVDASIWLIQFIKAMRDDEGKVLKNAHLIGTFRRVVKVGSAGFVQSGASQRAMPAGLITWVSAYLYLQLLFHNIRPVFVFDGGTPALKRKTVMNRKRRRDGQVGATACQIYV